MGVFDALKIAIVGGGFGGVALAIALKKAGIDTFTIYEKESDAGGVWRDNSYPGAACDVPSRFYSYSFEQDYPWSRRFAPQAEILAYLKHCIEKYRIDRHIRYDTEIAGATFDPSIGCWKFTTADGRQFDAHVFVSATGLFSRPVIPEIPGADTFAGRQFHSARWDHDLSLDGKTVAVIGSGASAIQFVPAIAPVVKQLHLFQRTPHYVLPRPDAQPAAGDRPWHERNALLRRLDRLGLFFSFERAGQRRRSDWLTRRGERNFLKFLESQITDPELRKKLTPSYHLGCKRVLFSSDWYPALARPNVAVIDTPIEAIVPEGIRTQDGQVRSADVIIYGTGFSPDGVPVADESDRHRRPRPARDVERGRRSLSRHHGDRLSQHVHALRPQHQCHGQHHLHAGMPGELHRAMHPRAARRPGLHGCARQGAEALQHEDSTPVEQDGFCAKQLPQLFPRSVRQDHDAVARLHVRLPPSHAAHA